MVELSVTSKLPNSWLASDQLGTQQKPVDEDDSGPDGPRSAVMEADGASARPKQPSHVREQEEEMGSVRDSLEMLHNHQEKVGFIEMPSSCERF